jgi:hypothetical protein
LTEGSNFPEILGGGSEKSSAGVGISAIFTGFGGLFAMKKYGFYLGNVKKNQKMKKK